MTQFRSKKDGSHYPIAGGKESYPKNNYVKKQIDGKKHLAVKGKIYTWNPIYKHYTSEDGWILTKKDLEQQGKTNWKKRLDLPYRVEYEFKTGNETIGKHGIMVLQDKKEGKSIIDKPEKLKTFSVIKREYKTRPHPGQTYKTLLKNVSKDEAVAFMDKYMQNHNSG